MNPEPRITRRQFLKKSKKLLLGAAVILATGSYSTLIEPFWIEIKKVHIKINNLPPAFDGFKIIHFSDIHLGFHFQPGHLPKIVQIINRLKGDLICFTGDLLDTIHSLDSLPGSISALQHLKAPLGKLAVLGNHDYMAGVDRVSQGLRQSGFQLLINENTVVSKKRDLLFISGIDDSLFGYPSLEKATANVPDNACHILLSHEPDIAEISSRYRIDLQLSGHTHGGQVRLPFVGPILTPDLGKNYVSGLYRVKHSNLQVYTNRGLGTTHLPIRFLCRPEITLITLEKAKDRR